MPKILKEPRYLVVRPEDRGYQTLHDHFPDLPNDTVYTVVSDTLPADLVIPPKNCIIACYYLDQIMVGQDCVATSNGKANASVFFEDFYRIVGIQRIHALAHLVLSAVGDYTDENHVTDRVFADENGNFYLAFSAELNLDRLHALVERLSKDLHNLLTKGEITGAIAKLATKRR
jgi:hypothetical protein